MPFASIGLAVGRISTNAAINQSYTTYENYSRFNTATDSSGTITRSTYAGQGSTYRSDASGGRTAAQQISSGYVPGFAIGGGIEALLGENIMFRAEYSRIYFSEYKGVNVVVDSARVGAGIKF
jgi:opacity protein-like surface antigen